METQIISKCPWDLNSYSGRWMYFFWITNPKLNFTSTATIEKAKMLILSDVCGSVSNNTTEAQLFYAKQVYENAFHPDTTEKQNILGRLSFLPIGKPLLVAAILSQLTKNSSSYVWHGINQSYDSLVNFTNRNGDTKLGQTKFELSFLAATIVSTFAAFHIEKCLTSKICHPLLYRFIPLSTLIVASIINVPIMRHSEIIEGVAVYDCNKEKIGYSKLAAIKGIGETIITRIVMFGSGICLTHYLDVMLDNQSCWYRQNKWVHFPFKTIGCGLLLIGMMPTACAIFPQFSSIETRTLQQFDKEAYTQITENCSRIPDQVYFNKGL